MIQFSRFSDTSLTIADRYDFQTSTICLFCKLNVDCIKKEEDDEEQYRISRRARDLFIETSASPHFNLHSFNFFLLLLKAHSYNIGSMIEKSKREPKGVEFFYFLLSFNILLLFSEGR